MVGQWIYCSLILVYSLAATGDGQRDASDVYSFRTRAYSYNKPALPSLPTYAATSSASSLLNQQSHVVFQRPLVNPSLHVDSYGASFVQPSLASRSIATEVNYSSGTQAPLLSGYSSLSGSWQPTYVPSSSDNKVPAVGTYSSLSAKDPREDISSQHIPYLISNEYKGTSAPEIGDLHTSSQNLDILQKYGIQMPFHLQQTSNPSNDDQYVLLPDMSSSTQNGINYPGHQQIGQQEGQGHRRGVVLPSDRLGVASRVAEIGTNAGQLADGTQPFHPNTDSTMAGIQRIRSFAIPRQENNVAAILPAYTRSNVPPYSLPTASTSTSSSAFMSVAPPNTPRSDADEKAISTVSMLTQQILRLPAVIYMNLSSIHEKQIEYYLRDTYNLPLVAFYIDKLDNRIEVESLLQQLTGYKGLPYIFICGKFVGSQQHLDNYHRNGQIAELVEKVCALNNERSEHRSV